MGIMRKVLEPLQNERGQFNFQDFLDQFDFSGASGGGAQTGGVQRERSTGGGGAFPTGSGLFDILTTPTGPGQRGEGQIGRGIRESRQGAATAFNQRLPQLLQTLMGSLGFGQGGFGGPSRQDLLDPRLGDIGDVAESQRQQIGSQASAQGRNIASSPFQRALAQVGSGEQRERQRATGDVDTLLAQLGQGQQGIMLQLLQSILGGGGLFG